MKICNQTMRMMEILIAILVLLVATACSLTIGSTSQPTQEAQIMEVVVTATPQPPEPTEEAVVEPTESPQPQYLQPGEPPGAQITLKDVDGSLLAYERRVTSGDYFLENLYERPFTSIDMGYLPDVDIQTVTISADNDFYYFGVALKSLDPTENRLTGSYGIELDRSKRGRGDFLVWVRDPANKWSTDNLAVYIDQDRDVGGLNPWIANAGHIGDGYETPLTFEGDRVAYARLAPNDPQQVQFAVSRALLDGAYEFLFGAYADRGWQNPGRFEYNDFIGPTAAGSPIQGAVNYPIKDLYGLDNTCRRAHGFAPTYDIRGMCTSKPIEEAPGQECEQFCFTFGDRRICYAICE